MAEVVRVVVRSLGIVIPAALLLGLQQLRGGAQEDDYGSFLGAMALSWGTTVLWSRRDASRTPLVRTVLRWAAVTLVVGVGLGLATTLLAPGSPPGERAAETVAASAFYVVPLLVAAGLGMLIGRPQAPAG